jgi:hypothetical protein
MSRLRQNSYTVLTIEVSAFDGSIVFGGNAHVGPVNVTRLDIDNDSIRNSTSGDNDFSVRPVGVSRMNPTAACFQEE